MECEEIVNSLKEMDSVSGRLELVYQADFSIYVDYAHTPDGLEKSLTALKKICKKRLICVFGCGGNRDETKRALMGKISGTIADFTVITSDNPRYEDPMDIIWQIEEGCRETTKNYVIVSEREEAIKYAINYAKIGDIIIVAGKGSEKYQEVLGVRRNYNDKDTINKLLRSEV